MRIALAHDFGDLVRRHVAIVGADVRRVHHAEQDHVAADFLGSVLARDDSGHAALPLPMPSLEVPAPVTIETLSLRRVLMSVLRQDVSLMPARPAAPLRAGRALEESSSTDPGRVP